MNAHLRSLLLCNDLLAFLRLFLQLERCLLRHLPTPANAEVSAQHSTSQEKHTGKCVSGGTGSVSRETHGAHLSLLEGAQLLL